MRVSIQLILMMALSTSSSNNAQTVVVVNAFVISSSRSSTSRQSWLVPSDFVSRIYNGSRSSQYLGDGSFYTHGNFVLDRRRPPSYRRKQSRRKMTEIDDNSDPEDEAGDLENGINYYEDDLQGYIGANEGSDDDFFTNDNDISDSDSFQWMSELKARQKQLQQQVQDIISMWRNAASQDYPDDDDEDDSTSPPSPPASLTTSIAVTLPADYVRRMDAVGVTTSSPNQSTQDQDDPSAIYLVACGSCSGSIYIAEAETGGILAEWTRNPFDSQNEDDNHRIDRELLERTILHLYGKYDGGGTLDIAFAKIGTASKTSSSYIVCEAPRTGGVHVLRLTLNRQDQNAKDNAGDSSGEDKSRPSATLVSQGNIPALQGVLVTCVVLQDDHLWIATADGRIQVYPVNDGNEESLLSMTNLPLVLQTKPKQEWRVGSTNPDSKNNMVLSLSICAKLDCAVASLSSGSVELIHPLFLDEDDEGRKRVRKSLSSILPPFDSGRRRSSNAFPRCAIVVEHEKRQDKAIHDSRYSIICGGNDGGLFAQPLNIISGSDNDEDGNDNDFDYDFREERIDDKTPFTEPLYDISPPHDFQVMSLAQPCPGLFASASQDGTLRVWDLTSASSPNREDRKSACLYLFTGYKVWIGSVWTDGKRIMSDGADNTVIQHVVR